MRTLRWTWRLAWAAVVVLAIIGLAAVTRRVLDLAHIIPPTPETMRGGAFDAGFAQTPLLTLIHILPGSLFMVLGPLQLVGWIRRRHLWLHRLLGRVYVATSVVVGLSAVALNFAVAIGGAVEIAATLVFAPLFLYSLLRGFLHARRHEIRQHREWMIRAFALGLAVATMRPLMGMFFALTPLTPQQFFGLVFWIGFTLHLIVAELWIRATRSASIGRLGVARQVDAIS